MRRLTWVLIGAILLSACAHVNVTAYDYQANNFQLCGNKYAGQSDFWDKAHETCSGHPQVLSCGLQQRGTVHQAVSSTMAVSTPVYGTCCLYHCQ